MRVTLATHGGQAAAITLRLPPRELDTGGLSPEEAGELRDLVAAACAAGGSGGPDGAARDAMSYTITVELTAGDTAMSPAFAALLSWIERHSG